MSEKRIRAYCHGLFAERVPVLLLRAKSYRILAHRYEMPVGEIDLVALKGRRLVFVEVKGYYIAFDVVLAAPWAWPRYIKNAFPV